MKLNKEQFFSKLKKGEVKNFIYNGVKYYSSSFYNGKKIQDTQEYTGKKFDYNRYEIDDVFVLTPKETTEQDFKYSGVGLLIKVQKNDKNDVLLSKISKKRPRDPKINLKNFNHVDETLYSLYIKINKKKFNYYLLSRDDIRGDYTPSIKLVKKLDETAILYNMVG